MKIPIDQLSEEALLGVIHDVVTRDGTELTDAELKVEQVRRSLASGRAELHFDEESGSCAIVAVEELRGRRGGEQW
jgi:uncharacterized protein YheU (UPF0270 family)